MHDLRDSTTDKHRQVDDESYGGGPGMVLKPEPVFAAVESLGAGIAARSCSSPAGRGWTRTSPASSPPNPGWC